MLLLFFGDSLTSGYGDESGLGWVGRIAARIMRSGTDLTWYNLGIRANTSADILARWQDDTGRRLMPDTPCTFVLSLGAADIARGLEQEQTIANTEALLQAMSAMDNVLFIGPPPSLRERYGPAASRLDAAFRKLTEQFSVPYVSSLSELAAVPAYESGLAAGDGIHPDAAGYALWADALAANRTVQQFFNLD